MARLGRKPHQPTSDQLKQVKAMSAYGVPEHAIAKVIGIHPETLRKYYRDELDMGMAEANAKVAESLYKKALGDGPSSVTAAIFWCKTRMGWRETSQAVTVSGDKDNPLQIEHNVKADESFATLVRALDGVFRATKGSNSSES